MGGDIAPTATTVLVPCVCLFIRHVPRVPRHACHARYACDAPPRVLFVAFAVPPLNAKLAQIPEEEGEGEEEGEEEREDELEDEGEDDTYCKHIL